MPAFAGTAIQITCDRIHHNYRRLPCTVDQKKLRVLCTLCVKKKINTILDTHSLELSAKSILPESEGKALRRRAFENFPHINVSIVSFILYYLL
jgi:hypothetical protein